MKVDMKPYSQKMDKTLEVLAGDFAAVRAGRASASLLDRISVEYYGQETPINQVGSITSPDPRTLVIEPWDKSLLKLIEKAIQVSDLGINPQNDGRIIRLVFPQLTEERRKELTKQVKKYGEEGKVAVRNIRRDAMDEIKKKTKKSEITEDDQKNLEKELQDLTDKRCKEIDELTAYFHSRLRERPSEDALPWQVESLVSELIDRAKGLTGTERVILRYYAEGYAVKDISGLLFISVGTVKGHNSHIYSKLGVNSYDSLKAYLDVLRRCERLEELLQGSGK